MKEPFFDKFTWRGIIFSGLSLLGLGYEIFFAHPIRSFVIIMYSFVVGIGMICIFILKENRG